MSCINVLFSHEMNLFIVYQWSESIPHQCETARHLSIRVCIWIRRRSAHKWPACGIWVHMELRSAARISSSLGCRPSLDVSSNSAAVVQTGNFYSAAMYLFRTITVKEKNLILHAVKTAKRH